jgi:1,2-dihydroxy-3-keto-5-methylthiopentene dioxygenase
LEVFEMAIVRVPDKDLTLTDPGAITISLASIGIDYEQWLPEHAVEAGSPSEEILKAYAGEIERLSKQGGYVTADVINVTPQTPGLDEMLLKFSREHTHDDDEVRFIIHGRGIFHIRPRNGEVTAIEVEAGDLIRVPANTWHWFDLCADREIRAIRLFKDPTGWVPRYTESGIDRDYQPVCLGPEYLPLQHHA